jgi:hypothetical protein
MIHARHQVLAEAIFRPYITGLLERSFRALRILGEAPRASPDLPMIAVANHNTWWDGFFIYLLNSAVFHRKLYVMMLEEQLRRFPFFSSVGAFSIRPGRPRSVIESLSYSAALLSRRDTLLCIFPRGELVPYGARPLGFKRGLERILKIHGKPVNLVQTAMKCEFLEERKPDVFFLTDAGRELSAEDFPGMENLEAEQLSLMDRLDSEILRGARGRVLLGSRKE